MGKILILAVGAAIAASTALADATRDEQAFKRRLGYAGHYVKEFEQEVARQRGGEKRVWHTKNDALQKVQELKSDFPDDPEVEALFQRVKKALMASKGDFTDIKAEWTAYLHNEENLRELISKAGEEKWRGLIAANQGKCLEKLFPAPDSLFVM